MCSRPMASIVRSAILVLRITDDRAEVDRLTHQVMERFRRSEAEARDLMLVGSVAEIQDKLGRLRFRLSKISTVTVTAPLSGFWTTSSGFQTIYGAVMSFFSDSGFRARLLDEAPLADADRFRRALTAMLRDALAPR